MSSKNEKPQGLKHIQERKIQRRWRKLALILGAAVAVITTALLVLPALTMENGTPMLQCQLELHEHTDACYDNQGNIICGYADFVVHTHDDSCYSEDGTLICPLKEIKTHSHDASCYREIPVLVCGQEETQGHTHTDACYEQKNSGKLICGQEEAEGHSHGEACYREVPTLACGQEEAEDHIHTDACYKNQKELICGQEEQEGHTHDESCYEKEPELTCGKEESQGHVHGEACYELRRELACGQEEILLHTHDSGCFDADGNIICGKTEIREHVHDDSCIPPEKTEEEASGASAREDESWATVNKPGFVMQKGRFAAARANAGRSTDFGQYITQVSIKKEVDGSWVETGQLTSGDSVRVTISYTIPAGIVGEDSRTIHYQLPQGIGLREREEGTVMNGSDAVGTYSIDTNGMITMTFDHVFADDQPFTGDLTFGGTVTATGGEEDDEIIFGGSGGSITVTPKEEESDISIAKAGWYEASAQAIGYTIKVSSEKGTDGPVSLTDAFLTGNISYDMDFSGYSFKITGADGQEITGYQLSVSDSSPASFTLTGLPALKAGDSYTITYAAVPDFESIEPGDGYLQFTNRAVARDNKNEAEAQINTVVSKAMAYKEGTYDAVARKVSWTIALNQNMQDIRGYVLKDTLVCRDASGKTYTVALPEEVSITPYLGSNPIGESSVIPLPYTFPENLSDEYATCSYLITYEMDLPEGVPEGTALTFQNKVIFGRYEAEAEVEVPMPGELEYDVQKAFWGTADSSKTMNWASLITYPQDSAVIPDSLTYVDWILDVMKEDESFLSGTHYTTANLLSGAYLTSADEKILLTYGEDYTVQVVPQSAMPDVSGIKDVYAYLYMDYAAIDRMVTWYGLDEVYASGKPDEPLSMLKITFTRGALEKLNGQSILIHYQTTLAEEKLPEDIQLTVGNLARIPADFFYASTSHMFHERLNKQVSPTGVVEGSTDTGSYTDNPLTLNSGDTGGLLHYRILLSGYDNGKEIVVKDTLPAGTELVQDSVVLRNHAGGDGSFTDSTSDAWYLSVETQKEDDGTTEVTFTIRHQSDFQNAMFGIYYDVSFADDSAWKNGEARIYENNAVWDGETDSTTTTVRKTLPILEKTGEQIFNENGEPTDGVRYYVAVNPDGRDLHPDSAAITLTDQMKVPAGSAATLRLETVAVYRYDPDAEEDHYCGNPIDPAQYRVEFDSQNDKIVFTLPDSTPCIVVYEYTIERGSAAAVDIEVFNTATLSGQAETSSGSGIIIEEQTSGASVNKATLTIYKYDSENAADLLSGARFKLERYEHKADGSHDWALTALTAQGPDGTFVVNENGYIVLSFVDYVEDGSLYNTLYRLTEVEAPPGYETGGEPYYFVWMEKGATREETIAQMQDTWAGTGIPSAGVKFIEYSTNDSLNIPNDPVSLTVEKVWQDEDGALLETPEVEKVTATLYQWNGEEKNKYETVELNGENGWSHTWTELPKTAENGGEYRYTVEEEHISGYETTYSPNNAEGVQTGTLTIINKKGTEYVLPETGGSGPALYAAAGLILIGASFAGGQYLRRKRGKKGETS